MTDALRRALAALDGDRLLKLAFDAVDLYTPTYAEQPATALFEQALRAAGLDVLRQPVAPKKKASPHEPPRANLLATIGPSPPAMLLCGHVDTIQLWPEQQPGAAVEDGMLRGLGACDMKGACAAMVETMVVLAKTRAPHARGLGLALVVGEEEYGDGTAALVETVRAPLVVVGEPTGLSPCPFHWSYLETRLKARGNRAHAALPEVGESAVHAMLAWVNGILEGARRVFDAEEMAVSLRSITGGGRDFVVAETCEGDLDVHLAPQVPAARIRALIAEARDLALAQHASCTLETIETFWAPGYAIGAADPRARAVEAGFRALGLEYEPGAFRSHSDASQLHEASMAPVVLGPGHLALAHTRDERVAVADLLQAARLYTAIACAACLA